MNKIDFKELYVHFGDTLPEMYLVFSSGLVTYKQARYQYKVESNHRAFLHLVADFNEYVQSVKKAVVANTTGEAKNEAE